ncbi:sphingosine-1-phosphate phosphatase 1 [Scyliorhinus canicula]|uniref:sphingosine-1-phosphate phosphatase 1 n=1 Tax=Scyliorhinus canicula TaxID=7830 RepID=UPI0018F69F85|nr:sphingosine-1-phosphate phosphatase 1 [Scyliorhinus canicula]
MGLEAGGWRRLLRYLYRYLHHPDQVARFQRLCGLVAAHPPLSNGDCRHPGAAGAGGERGTCCRPEEPPSPPDSGGQEEEARPPPAKENGVACGSAGPARPGGDAPAPAPRRRREGAAAGPRPRRRNSLNEEAGGAEFVVGNRLLYYLFSLGTELGNELFYITFFPFWLWNIDPYVGRRLIVIWVWVMYLGQCTKDIIRWPRPRSPPVIKVEIFYDSEYGMPSTHAMSGTAIPFSLFFLTVGRWQYPYAFGLLLASIWCILVCLSRLYMGMHSILDVIAGVLYSILILVIFHPAMDLIDNFNLTYKYAPLFIISLHLGMGLFSFTLDTWSTSRGDTAEILGTGAGIACASHFNYMFGILPDPPLDVLPFSPPAITINLITRAFLRFAIGVVVLLLTRAVLKACTIPLACKIFRIPCTDIRQARKRMEVELPYRYMTYGMVGFVALFVVPCLFNYLNLS